MTINQMNRVGLQRLGTDLLNGWVWTIHDDGLRLWERSKEDTADYRVQTLFKQFHINRLSESIEFMNDWGYVYGQPIISHTPYGYKW
jgi:hypothetical protein